jgi:hypothetical protein
MGKASRRKRERRMCDKQPVLQCGKMIAVSTQHSKTHQADILASFFAMDEMIEREINHEKGHME